MRKAFFDLGPGVLNSEAWDKERWEDYEIFGLEPDSVRYETLKDIFPGTLLNIAVSDKNEELTGITHPTSGFIASGYPGCTGKVTVTAVTLDSVDEKYGPFDEIAIWADIEGSELKMLKGATKVLEKTKWITVEMHTHPKTEEWAKSHDVFEFLTSRGFSPDRSEAAHTEKDTCYDVTFMRPLKHTGQYMPVSLANTIINDPIAMHTFNPVSATTIQQVNLKIDGETRKYIGYASNVRGSEINLYYTNDLDDKWIPYSHNPILTSNDISNFRWPSTAFVDGVFHMFLDNNADSKLERWVSTDGIHFQFAENIHIHRKWGGNSNPFIWLNPNDTQWYLYWRDSSELAIKVNIASDITLLGNAESLTVITEKETQPSLAASPSIIYAHGKYWLLLEGLIDKVWKTYLFTSKFPNKKFKLQEIVLTDNAACGMQHFNEDYSKMYLYISKLTGNGWVEETYVVKLNEKN